MNHNEVKKHADECVRLNEIKRSYLNAMNGNEILSDSAHAALCRNAQYYEQELFKEEQKLKCAINE